MIAGSRRRSGLDLSRNRRPRIAAWATIAAVAAIVIGEVAADVVNSGAPAAQLAGKSYAAAVVPIIEESTALRLWLTDVRRNAVALGRLGLETALARLVAGSHSLELQLANLGLPAPDPRSGRLLSDVLAARASAARFVMGGVALAIGPSRDLAGATATLMRAGGRLAGSDNDYSRFVSSLPPYVRRSVPMPQSRWDTPSEWTAPALARFAALIGGSPRLLIHQSLVIVAISLEPPALRIVGLSPAPASPGTGTGTTGTGTRGTGTSSSTTTTTTLPAGTGSSLTPTTGAATTTTSSTTSTTTTLQLPPAGSVSCLQPTNRLSVDVVVANAGDVAAFNVELSATLTELAPPGGGSAKGHKHGAGGHQAAPPSCGQDQGTTGGAVSAGSSQSQDTNPGLAGGGLTVRHELGLLAAGRSDYVTMPSMAVQAGRSYVLTVRLADQRESVTLQVASG